MSFSSQTCEKKNAQNFFFLTFQQQKLYQKSFKMQISSKNRQHTNGCIWWQAENGKPDNRANEKNDELFEWICNNEVQSTV